MPASNELAADAAQEVRVAMIPVGDQRVTENYDAHARDSAGKTIEERTPARGDALSALEYALRYPLAMRSGVYVMARVRAARARCARSAVSAISRARHSRSPLWSSG